MVETRKIDTTEVSVKLPMWLQCVVAFVGAVALLGPAAAVVWYR